MKDLVDAGLREEYGEEAERCRGPAVPTLLRDGSGEARVARLCEAHGPDWILAGADPGEEATPLSEDEATAAEVMLR